MLKAERGLSPSLGKSNSGTQTEVSAQPKLCEEQDPGTGAGLCLDGTHVELGAHPALHPQLRDTLALSQLNWEGWNHPQELKVLPQQTKFSREEHWGLSVRTPPKLKANRCHFDAFFF